ncbi:MULTISPECIES: hypothetical protein [Prochlorococcus]|uniref:hypothetical protein n=1 Tax=Prochlorococcus TaxID=1218 RepID=UPI0007B39D4D|nr:hypothetical protein [Prochlorococcus marinus]
MANKSGTNHSNQELMHHHCKRKAITKESRLGQTLLSHQLPKEFMASQSAVKALIPSLTVD